MHRAVHHLAASLAPLRLIAVIALLLAVASPLASHSRAQESTPSTSPDVVVEEPEATVAPEPEVVEEPVVEEPVVEEPVVEEPVAEEPAAEEPVAEEPAAGTSDDVVADTDDDGAPLGGASDAASEEVTTDAAEHGAATESSDVEGAGGVNQPPVAVDDAYTTLQGTALVVPGPGVLANDTDPEGDPLDIYTFTYGQTPGDVEPEFAGNAYTGGFTYTPYPALTGPVQFTYGLYDGTGGAVYATVTITVIPNQSPVANGDAYTVRAGETLTVPAPGVLANDTDPEGDPLTVRGFTYGQTPGTVDPEYDGNRATGGFAYTPSPSTSGPVSFTYELSDGVGESVYGTVTITVTPNQPPVPGADAYTVRAGQTLTVPAPGVLANDTDPEGDAVRVTGFTYGQTPGTVEPEFDGNGHTGGFAYTPSAGYAGPVSFTYQLTDAGGAFSYGEVTITVEPAANRNPDAVTDAYTTPRDTQLVVDAPGLLANDTDPDGDALTASPGSQTPLNGTLLLDGDGGFVYTPNAGFVGEDTFSYVASDGRGGGEVAGVVVTITNPNDIPLARDDAYATDEGTPLVVEPRGVLDNDSVPGGGPFTLSPSEPAAANGTVVLRQDGSFTYTPNAGFFGTDSFTYTLTNARGGFDTATVTIEVRERPNRGPAAVDDAYTTPQDTPLTVPAPGVLANDSDPDGDPLDVLGSTQPTNGTLAPDGDGGFVYTPDAGFSGTDTFEYQISDGAGGTDGATVTITVTAPESNENPDAADDAYTTPFETALTVAAPGLLANDTDPDGDPLTAATNAPLPANGAVTISPNGGFTYTPNAGFTGVDSFAYQVADGNGGFDRATVTITVGDPPANQAPDTVDDAATTDEEVDVDIDVLANDVDADGDPLSVTGATDPSNGTTEVTADGSIIYRPDAGFVGQDSFDYTVSDGELNDTATVTVTVVGIPGPPEANDDEATTDEDTSITVAVLANDVNEDGVAYTVVGSAGPASNGTVVVNADQTVTYSPNANFSGTDTFQYTASNPVTPGSVEGVGEAADSATVTITVQAVDDGPAAVDDAASTDEDSAVTVDVLANDTHPDGVALTLAAITVAPANGTAELAGGQVVYTPGPGFAGVDTFTYSVADPDGDTDEAVVTVTVVAVEEPLAAVDDDATTDEDTAVTVDVLANDVVPDGRTASVTSAGPASNGDVVVNPDGSVTYTPDADFNGADSFPYTIAIDDVQAQGNPGGGSTAIVSIVVRAVDDPRPPIDADADGVADADDNCPADANPDQEDTDGDGEGDVCDGTPDGDPTPTPTEEPSEEVPTATPTRTPVAGTLPNTGAGQTNSPGTGMLALLLCLGALTLIAGAIAVRRERRPA